MIESKGAQCLCCRASARVLHQSRDNARGGHVTNHLSCPCRCPHPARSQVLAEAGPKSTSRINHHSDQKVCRCHPQVFGDVGLKAQHQALHPRVFQEEVGARQLQVFQLAIELEGAVIQVDLAELGS
jgi:hypothetical protein